MSRTTVNNWMVASDVARPNLLQNGSFEQWRGPGPFTASPAIQTFADPWGTQSAGGNISVVPETVTVDGSQYSAHVTATSVTGQANNVFIIQTLRPSDTIQLRGKTVTYSARVLCSTANAAKIRLQTDGGTNASAYHSGGGGWETLSVIVAIPANTTTINLTVDLDASTTLYVDNASLTVGQVAPTYSPKINYEDAVPNGRLASDVGRANILVNGGFENWQRGNGPFTSSNTSDRWGISLPGASTLSVSKSGTTDTSKSTASASLAFTSSGGAAARLMQLIEGYSANLYSGQVVSFSARVNASVANTVRLLMYNGGAYVFSAPHTGDGTWQTLTLTTTMTATTTGGMYAGFDCYGASATVLVDNAMLVLGSMPCDYVPMHQADEWARQLRYYELRGWGGSGGNAFLTGICSAATNAIFPLEYKVQKPPSLAPTITFTAPASFAIYNSAASYLTPTGMTASSISPQQANISATVASGIVAGNATCLVNYTSAGYIAIESNP